MGPVAFRYYVQAAIRYIRSDAAADDHAIISCMAMILEFSIRSKRKAGFKSVYLT